MSETPSASAGSGRASLLRRIDPTVAGVFIAALAVYIFFAFATRGNGFVTINGTAAWANFAAELGIVAIAVSLLMIAGEFDLSIGSTIGAASVLVALCSTTLGLSIWLSVLIALMVGCTVGIINGLIVTRTNLPSFIVTLAMNFSVAGAGLAISRALANTTTISVTTTPLAKSVFAGRFGQANVSIIWWLGLTLLAYLVLRKTVFGNWIYATGGNLQAAKASGVPVARVKIVIFAFAGLCAALLGVIQAIQFNTGNAASGQGFVFQAPIVAVIGGVLLTGGYGSAIGVMLGAAAYGIIATGVFYTGWPSDYVLLLVGIILLLAVLANGYFRQLALKQGER